METGIHAPAMFMGRVLHDPHVIHPFVNHPDGHPEFIGYFHRLVFAATLPRRAIAEGAGKMDGRYSDPLVDHDLYGQGTV